MGQETRRVNSHLHGDYPDAVYLEDKDGLYWVAERDISVLRSVTGIEYNGARVGFDGCGAMAQALALMKRGVRVGLRRGDSVRMLRPPTPRRPVTTKSTPVFLAPELLVEAWELAKLEQILDRRSCRFKESFERWRTSFLNESGVARAEPIAVYVYQLAGGMYEVEWELTDISESSFEGFVLAAHLLGRKIPCRLVTPRQRHQRRFPNNQVELEEPVTYGQLRLAL